MVLHFLDVGPPVTWVSVTSVGPPWIVLFEFEVDGQPSRNICFTKRPRQLYRALTKVVNKKWKGEKVEFTGSEYKGYIEKNGLTQVHMAFVIYPPYALRCKLSLNPQEVNAILNKMGILLM